MWTNDNLGDGVLNLRCLFRTGVTEQYLKWLSDPIINQYLEVRHAPPTTLIELKNYVSSIISSNDSIIFGIYAADDEHIGNIKIGPIDLAKREAHIGIIIGEKHYWGKGYAARAIQLACAFSFNQLGLSKVFAGAYQLNLGSQKAFMKAGFNLEETLKDYWIFNGNRIDELVYSRKNDLNLIKKKEKDLTDSHLPPKTIVFIGGGMLMIKAIQIAINLQFEVVVILASRHAKESSGDGTLIPDLLRGMKVKTHILDSVNQLNSINIFTDLLKPIMGLCFGPAWIFPEDLCKRFSGGIFNFNGIPLPKYLGGAHYTWQILNSDKTSGCYIQKITSNIDRGNIIFYRNIELGNNVKIPEDYFIQNEKLGIVFLNEYLNLVALGNKFLEYSFSHLCGNRVYFPRLLTLENAWIDWRWNGSDIAKFCNAFDAPYPGASTYYDGKRVFFRGVSLIREDGCNGFHPFCSGLVIRVLGGDAYIATNQGLLVAQDIIDAESGVSVLIHEGSRFHTDASTLERAILFKPKL